MIRTEQHGISVATRNQLHAPEDECSHDNLAQLAVGLHERQQLLPLEMNYFAGFAHPYLNHCASAGQHAGLTCELARTKRGHKVFVRTRWPNDIQAPSSDDEEMRVLRAGFDKDFASLDRTTAASWGGAGALSGLPCGGSRFGG